MQDNILTLLTELRAMLKHLPGKHSQAAHASKKGSASQIFMDKFKVSSDDYETIAKIHGQDWGAKVSKTYNFQSRGMKAALYKVKVDGDTVTIKGHIHEDDFDAGYYKRTINPDKSVHHDSFELHHSVQGKGFGSDFYQHNEESYMDIGIERITLDANMSVGGYAWARMGFDFVEEYAREEIHGELDRAYLDDYGEESYTGWSAWDIASDVAHDGRKVGKEVMLGSRWDAAKDLSPDSEGFKVGQAYYAARKKKRLKQTDPHVENDRNGFWGVDEVDDEWLAVMKKLRKKKSRKTGKK